MRSSARRISGWNSTTRVSRPTCSSELSSHVTVRIFRVLATRYTSISCEMEGGAVGHACYINEVPFFVIRVISDEADGSAPENYEEYAHSAAKKSTEIIRRVVKKISAGE